MIDYQVSPHAAQDLNEIWAYQAKEHGDKYADDGLRRLMTAFRGLAEWPGKGHRRQDLTDLPLYFFHVAPYLVVYDPRVSPLAIHAVLHPSRDVSQLLPSRV